MHRVIVVGSPRPGGRSAALADELFNACIEECPEDGVSIVSVASTEVRPCVGCDACRAESDAPLFVYEEGDPLLPVESVAESGALFHRCVIDDDMAEVRKHLDAADELIVVAPVYFACVPAQLKALLDRLQPYFWTNLRTYPKRPACVHVVGEGGDPHGFEPMIGTLRSALSVAGFQIESVLDWVGKITPEGEIIAEADEYELAWEETDDASAEADAARDDGLEWAAVPEGAWDAELGDEWPDDLEEASLPGRREGAMPLTPNGGDSRARAKLSVSQKPPKQKSADTPAKPRKPKPKGAGGGPAYGKKNTKRKGNGHGGRR
ncbi:MAG: flavodoxin family protein [Adlercreutzia sp.]|uniref:flavodoxin family protein n=1 Tax=uncultured Adlercreutzia sp. TaxID=875803 RepID=UPI002171FCFA|nr:flavodoxin family protein [uncultured Adlercreutzia sp.]MCI8424880.1 flavodoxin family protein [Adlercreutzia sp.]